jgi:hypothetical protein
LNLFLFKNDLSYYYRNDSTNRRQTFDHEGKAHQNRPTEMRRTKEFEFELIFERNSRPRPLQVQQQGGHRSVGPFRSRFDSFISGGAPNPGESIDTLEAA